MYLDTLRWLVISGKWLVPPDHHPGRPSPPLPSPDSYRGYRNPFSPSRPSPPLAPRPLTPSPLFRCLSELAPLLPFLRDLIRFSFRLDKKKFYLDKKKFRPDKKNSVQTKFIPSLEELKAKSGTKMFVPDFSCRVAGG